MFSELYCDSCDLFVVGDVDGDIYGVGVHCVVLVTYCI